MSSSLAQMPLRLPRSLHGLLKKMAEREGVSLNQYCLYLLARYSGGEQMLIQDKKGEELMHFLEEAQALQKEMNSPAAIRTLPQETPPMRWKELYGKA